MNLIKSTGTFSLFVILSRILGYIRDFFIAIYLGSGPIADAFFVAFRIPNTFRRLFAEGTFNAAFVPSYTSELLSSKKKAQKFANSVFNLLVLALLSVTILVEIFMPSFIKLIAPGLIATWIMVSIYGGIATVTETAATGALAALAIGIKRKKVNFNFLRECLSYTLSVTGRLFWLTMGSTSLIGVFSIMGGTTYLKNLILLEFFEVKIFNKIKALSINP